jgi:hypothetical protein
MASEDLFRSHQVDVKVNLMGGESNIKRPGHRDGEGDDSEAPQDRLQPSGMGKSGQLVEKAATLAQGSWGSGHIG